MTSRVVLTLLIVTCLIIDHKYSSAQQMGFPYGQVVGSTGSESQVVEGKRFIYTVGEAIISTLTSPGASISMTQGFNQPEFLVISETDNALTNSLGIQIFPNPTIGTLFIRAQNPIEPDLEVRVINLYGQQVIPTVMLFNSNSLDCGALPAGYYFAEIFNARAGRQLFLPFIKI